jgi:Subtilase family
MAMMETNMVEHRAKGADKWFKDLTECSHRLLSRYEPDRASRVRIAILDTGIELTTDDKNRTPALLWPYRHSFKRVRDFIDKPATEQPHPGHRRIEARDPAGHGTHGAALLLKVAPRADIYVGRVANLVGNDIQVDPQTVADAIEYAAFTWNVDIITMSFGFPSAHDAITTAINQATSRSDYSNSRFRRSDVLLFAAASNDGIGRVDRIAFPARAEKVIAVYSANWKNKPSSEFNPDPYDKACFIALGEQVESAWPLPVPVNSMNDQISTLAGTGAAPPQGISSPQRPSRYSSKRQTGTSIATVIAAATAALLIEFARQPPLCKNPNWAQQLGSYSGMTAVLKRMNENRMHDGFYPIIPAKYINADDTRGTPEGSDAADLKAELDCLSSARNVLAADIMKTLSAIYYNK